MTWSEYIIRAAGAWFVGFFPLAEIYVAIPAAMATGLDNISVVFWSVFGNFTPILLIHFFYERLIRIERVRAWFKRLVSERFKQQINQYGVWLVLLVTPWTGVWVMAVTAKTLGMSSGRLMLASFVSILIYAIALVALINAGVDFVSS